MNQNILFFDRAVISSATRTHIFKLLTKFQRDARQGHNYCAFHKHTKNIFVNIFVSV